MAKSKSDKETKKAAKADDRTDKKDAKPADGGWRETVESIAMAVILALLFRGFVAEAFVIPTGSMAPTLQGRHKDVWCPKCGVNYQTTASSERTQTGAPTSNHVTTTTCPICRYTQRLDLFNEPNDHSFSGDRIIVGKFCYDLGEPERWDVIVFKFPGDAVQNYIKRLIGLPNETILIVGGNVYAKAEGADDFEISRKPPHKLNVLLQLVDDTDHIPQELIDLGWPSRWQEALSSASEKPAWQVEDGGRAFVTDGAADRDAWLLYRHLVPSYSDWVLIEQQKRLPTDIHTRVGQLIPDFYAYNAYHDVLENTPDGARPASYLTPDRTYSHLYDPSLPGPGEAPAPESFGQHWVDDLAVECVADADGSEGELLLMVVRAGRKYQCRIKVADGQATLSMTDTDGQPLGFDGGEGDNLVETRTATTSVRGPGSYRLRLSNCDHELLLWVNGSVVKFDGPTTYPGAELEQPAFSAEDPLDLAPVRIGSRGAAVRLTGLRVYRDKYYIATNSNGEGNDYIDLVSAPGFVYEQEAIPAILSNPDLWQSTNMFAGNNRREVDFVLGKDQFLPLGDNSPQSFDGRFWLPRNDPRFDQPHNYVERDLLIGKALLIYWPHTWNRPIPFTPNFRKMGPIR
jgi:signal peptidase I